MDAWPENGVFDLCVRLYDATLAEDRDAVDVRCGCDLIRRRWGDTEPADLIAKQIVVRGQIAGRVSQIAPIFAPQDVAEGP
jgi:hypothetical protein